MLHCARENYQKCFLLLLCLYQIVCIFGAAPATTAAPGREDYSGADNNTGDFAQKIRQQLILVQQDQNPISGLEVHLVCQCGIFVFRIFPFFSIHHSCMTSAGTESKERL